MFELVSAVYSPVTAPLVIWCVYIYCLCLPPSVYSLSLIAVCSSAQYLGTLSLTVTLYLLVILRVVHWLAYLFVPVYF